MQKNPYLSIVIPAYNEVNNINKGVLDRVYEWLKVQKFTWELLLVDDKSTDKTLSLLNKYKNRNTNTKVLAEPHKGKAGSVIAGVLVARGEIILFTDMDQATPLDQFEKFIPHFEHNDIVIGSRSGRMGAPLIRKFMATGFSILRTLILRLPYKDTQCGFKAFNKRAAKEVFKRLKVFSDREKKGPAVTAGFDLEILYIARKLKLKVEEVPVDWHHRGTERVNAIRDSLQGIIDLLRVRINAFRGRYKT